jgi:hypothetical protein
VGPLTTNSKAGNARAALKDVCAQVATDREIVLCSWDAASSWGVQVADYALWAAQRILESRACQWWDPCIRPPLQTAFRPWGAPAST